MDRHFGCTMCGKCCHDLRVPLSLREATAWVGRGHAVEVLCEALPWSSEPPDGEALAHYRRDRSFPAVSGTLPVRITMILVGRHEGPCPNLLPDMRCAIYEERPLVCRIYPAEFNPFVAFDPVGKGCPPDAWAPSNPVLLHDGQYVDDGLRDLIARCRAAAVEDTTAKARLCTVLGIRSAALGNEGYMVHRFAPPALRDALTAVLAEPEQVGDAGGADAEGWTILSNRRTTVDTLRTAGAQYGHTRSGAYLGFFPDEA